MHRKSIGTMISFKSRKAKLTVEGPVSREEFEEEAHT